MFCELYIVFPSAPSVVVGDMYYAFTSIVWCFSLCHNTVVDETSQDVLAVEN
jgi:hypothetical protein